ncbi:SSI family serine proteinase inhibitor [Paraconexibacter algicola]|uniref:Subtilisin inhibitor domain-containing protein n=1 Tax=Paraconexibacter algicola TaxID=2133960 RepID=A0A2T4UG49_9ACTN|nr:SSI family serine proteinase inhibitor [Paraconexibacter algicola]PTL58159.1 hypothetical protein C7Y72_00085 [Paraconexibacter algicola]
MTTTRVLLGAAATALLLGLAACGDDGDGSTDRARDVTAASSLSITLQGPRSTRAFTLRCEPDGGTWPDAAAACEGLRAAPEVLEPIGIETRDLGVITDVPVTITGEFDGRAVNLAIPARGSSTRRVRFGQLREALGAEAFDDAAASVQ